MRRPGPPARRAVPVTTGKNVNKKHLGWLVRIVGVLLVGLIIWRIDYVDGVSVRGAERRKGKIVEVRDDALLFRFDGAAEPTLIPFAAIGDHDGALRLRDGGVLHGTPMRLGAEGDHWEELVRIDEASVVTVVDESGGLGVSAARSAPRASRDGLVVIFRTADGERTLRLEEIASYEPIGKDFSEGLIRIGRRIDLPIAIGSSFLFVVVSLIVIVRWQRLMAVQGLSVPLWECVRLTYLGFFFNNVVPGLTGGDVVKAYYIARQSEGARATAAVSVFVDRIIGLVALALLGGAVLAFRLDEAAFRQPGLVIYIFLACSIVGGLVFFSRRVRKLIRFERLLEVLPGRRVLREIDRSFFLYRYHKRELVIALILSLLNHSGLMVMNYGFGYALGITDVSLGTYFVLIPVVMMISSIPLLPGGWGLGEFAFAHFLGLAGVPFTQAIALSFVFRISNLLWSLPGGWFFVTRRHRVTREELEREAVLEEEAIEVAATGDDPAAR